MTYSSTFGTLLSRSLVEQAVINTLQNPPFDSTYPLLQYYVAEVERQDGLTARSLPEPGTIRGGIDLTAWQEDNLPLLIVTAQPAGDAERYEQGAYEQWYQVQVATIVEDSGGDQDRARNLADYYGAAVMGCLTQNGGLGTRTLDDGSTGTFAERTVLVSTPRTEFISDEGAENRRFAQSVVTVRTLVQHAVAEGAPAFGADPYVAPAAWPTITTVDVDFLSQKLDGTTGPQSGVTVTDSTGHIVVNE